MKKAITTITLAVVLTLGTTFANAGIIVAGKADTPPCSGPALDGIIVAGKAIINYTFGIIVAGKPGADQCVETGIIVAG